MRILKSGKRSLIAIAVSAALASHAWADDAKAVSVPPGDLTTALKALAKQSGVELVYRPEQLRGLRTNGVEGTLSSEQAVAKLLEGTSLKLREDASGILLITAEAARPADTAGVARYSFTSSLAQVDTAAAAGNEPTSSQPAPGGDPVEEVVVRGVTLNYDTVESANKMPIAIKDTPYSVKVITEDMLEFASINKVQDIYKIDAGGYATHQQDQWTESYFRGYNINGARGMKIDGFVASGTVEYDTASFERYEIIKGAMSTLYGEMPIGGMINAVSKKPQDEFAARASFEAGNYGHYRADFDVTGPLTSSGKLTGRFVGAYLDEDSFLDFAYNKKILVNPSLKYAFTDDTSLQFLFQYLSTEYLPSYGFGAQFLDGDASDPRNYAMPDVPRSRFVAANSANRNTYKDLIYSRLLLESKVAENWNLRGAVFYSTQDLDMKLSNGGSVDPDGIVGLSIYGRELDNGDAYGGEVNLFGDIELLGRKHTLFFGADYQFESGNDGMSYAGIFGVGNGFNIYDPDYSLLPDPARFSEYGSFATPYYLVMRSESQSYGATAQLVLRPIDKLQLILGTRYSKTHAEEDRISAYSDDPAVAGILDIPTTWDLGTMPQGVDPAWWAPSDVAQNAWTMQGGVTYAITPGINLYASYSEGFIPRADLLADGSPLGPEESTAYEVGVKGELQGGKFFWSAAAFDIARTNITDGIQGTPEIRLLGDQQSRGLEFDFQGQITEAWDIYGSLAYIRNEFVDGPADGQLSFLAPKFGASIFSNYEFRGGRLAGFGFGGGVVYKKLRDFEEYGFRPGEFGTNFGFLFDDPLEIDARAYYQLSDHARLKLSVTNLLDRKYYLPRTSIFWGLTPNPGRQAIVGFDYRF